ncbi:pyridoxal phosphate-dependent aminotransferase [Pseudomonas neustonica]|uniref:Aminotransferase n=1 Tax=Pseudomonas neustonica TaxID=2487346 RepID=A0ABX9XIJ8_9PSED|nr:MULTISPECIES: pyridoxal phosphate-dependent aminotransferase [Pseudomonas]ROZ81828.1 pyridoxal phosphate-dependent aminotransferase [Pseudomonas sp. SSM44]ROZ83671.1 pyridoxal phosphate-dependent aminotransferase [Pseudomonas neustonica]
MSQQRWAQRVQEIQPFHVMAVLARARELEAAGRDVIHMEIGEPDFTTPEPIIRAGQQALADGRTGYTPALGLPALREAIAGLYAQRYGIDLDPARVVVTPGGSAALLLISALLVEPGKKVLMADPAYPCNRHFLRLVEGRAVLVPTGPETRYQLTPELIEQHWDSDCVAVLAASPANPTGTLLERDELAAMSATCRRLGAELIVDEIYHGLTYGVDACSVLNVADDAFVLNSFSKYFGMTGWRLGWLVAPRDAVPALEKLAQNLYICAPHMAQQAALAAFNEQSREICEVRREAFQARRDFLLPSLRQLGFSIPVTPQGAFYLYADMQALGGDSQQLCQHVIDTEFLALTPGLDFGQYRADQHLRFAYTTSLERLEQGVERLARALQSWPAC